MSLLLCFSDLDNNRGPVWVDVEDVSSMSIILVIGGEGKGTLIAMKNGKCFNVAESVDDVSRVVNNARIVRQKA